MAFFSKDAKSDKIAARIDDSRKLLAEIRTQLAADEDELAQQLANGGSADKLLTAIAVAHQKAAAIERAIGKLEQEHAAAAGAEEKARQHALLDQVEKAFEQGFKKVEAMKVAIQARHQELLQIAAEFDALIDELARAGVPAGMDIINPVVSIGPLLHTIAEAAPPWGRGAEGAFSQESQMLTSSINGFRHRAYLRVSQERDRLNGLPVQSIARRILNEREAAAQ